MAIVFVKDSTEFVLNSDRDTTLNLRLFLILRHNLYLHQGQVLYSLWSVYLVSICVFVWFSGNTGCKRNTLRFWCVVSEIFLYNLFISVEPTCVVPVS